MNEQTEVAGPPKKQIMLYQECVACGGTGCRYCKVLGVMPTGATEGQLEYMAKLDVLRQEAGISAAMLRDGRARQMVELFKSKGANAMDDVCQLKVEINTFVWMHAPDDLTLRQADDMAVKILNLFLDARKAVQDGREPAMEPCCECGEDYPRADLVAGQIYCPKCRETKSAP